jgi:hypothetical protein
LSAALGVYVVLVDAALAKVPVPVVVHVEEVADPPLAPVSDTVITEEHTFWSLPALTVATGLMVNVRASLTAPHTVGGLFVVSVSVTLPADLSAPLGVYVVLRADVLAKVPVPEDDQVDDVADPPLVPVIDATSPAQMVWSAPALTVAAGLIVTVIASLTALQGPFGLFVVSVRTTLPANLSPALCVYVVLVDAALANVPVPEVVQVEEVAEPPLAPVSEAVAVVEQISWSAPAFTVAGFPMVTVMAFESALGQRVGATPYVLTV